MRAATIARRVGPHLPAGERHVVAFAAAEGPAARLAVRHRVVAVTDRAIHVFTARPWRSCDPGRLLSSHPLGAIVERPPKPLALAHEIVIGDRRLWVPVAWDDELAAAMAAGPGPPPPLAVTRSTAVRQLVLLLAATAIAFGLIGLFLAGAVPR
ncbi:MAG: hypothetical protein KDB35_23310 [Acidimicrobiales bacterium]|nr:hypothetical protein [Acidimicrobiales bacterium]